MESYSKYPAKQLVGGVETSEETGTLATQCCVLKAFTSSRRISKTERIGD